MTIEQDKNIRIKISKCAYLFNDYYDFYPYSKSQRDKKDVVMSELKKYYDNSELRKKELCGTIKKIKLFNGEEIERYYIKINGNEIALNALEIDLTSEKDSIINHRKKVDFKKINTNDFDFYFWNDSQHAYSKKFKSLNFENFTYKDSLQYIRIHFKGNYTTFIIDSRNGDLYTARGIEHKKIDINDIINSLDATSKDSKKAITDFILQLQNQ